MSWSSVIFSLLLYTFLQPITCYLGLTSKQPLFASVYQLPTYYRMVSRDLPSHLINADKLCDLLNLEPNQRQICRKTPGLAPLLLEAVNLAIFECSYQFQFERWNCSLDYGRLQMLNEAFKETAFLHSITSSSLMHSIARGCSSQFLDRCSCDGGHRGGLGNYAVHSAWKWSGCGDNTRYGQRFARRFLGLKRWGRDLRAAVDRHNAKVGMRTLRKSVKKQCKCHGVSGSCEIKTCWKQLVPFRTVSTELKKKYESAAEVTVSQNSVNSANGRKDEEMLLEVTTRDTASAGSRGSNPRKSELVYLEQSPSFCEASEFTPGVTGRNCRNREGCEALCCGRGYNVKKVTVTKPCNCEVIWCCEVNCDTCKEAKDVYTCK